jgi:hypothetical protein
MRALQLTPEARLAGGDLRAREEAVLEVMRQQRTVLQVFDRLPLGVQDPLDSLDDGVAMGQEEVEQLDMCRERHTSDRRSGRALFRRKERVTGQASIDG